MHFGNDRSTIEFATLAATDAECDSLERLANAIVAECREISVTFEDAAAATGLRKPTERTGSIRVVTIEGIDRSACGGTHANNTGEVGPVMLLGTERIRNHARVSFMAGDRVIGHARRQMTILASIATSLGCGVEDVERLLVERAAETRELQRHGAAMETSLAQAQISLLKIAAKPDADGLRRLVLRDAAFPQP